ncbi:MAG: hypothetical protein ACU0GG_20585 [Paracoccaceae bacterium]
MEEIDLFQNNQLSLAIRSYREPADDDYCCARWSYFNRLAYPFFWHAQQAIGKYLKCSLILNGDNIKGYESHNLLPLLRRAKELFGSLIPTEISRPPGFPEIDDPLLGFGELSTVVSLYSTHGNPNNRYGLYSTNWNRIGIHSLDELCFCLRRICGILDFSRGTGQTLRDVLLENPRYQISTDRTSKVEEFRYMNFSFFPEESIRHGKFHRTVMPGFTNSPISNLVGDDSEEALLAIQWFLDNAYLPKNARLELERYIEQRA